MDNFAIPSEEISQEATDQETYMEQAEDTEQPFNFELQYNKEKVVIDSEEKLRELAQKGMNYDKVYQKSTELEQSLQAERQKAVDEYIASQGMKWGDKPITTLADYTYYKQIDDTMKDLMNNQGFTAEQAARIAEAEAKASKVEERFNQQEAKAKEDQEGLEFLNWHESMVQKGVFKESFDATKIPQEVWDKVKAGEPMKSAFMEYQLTNLKTSTEQEVLKTIKENTQTSPGSVNDNSSGDDKPWSADFIEQMAEKMGATWVNANYDKIAKSGYFK